MANTIKLGDKDYDIDSLSEEAKANLVSLEFATAHLQELQNMQALLQRAKNSYVGSLKNEMLSNKAGFAFSND